MLTQLQRLAKSHQMQLDGIDYQEASASAAEGSDLEFEDDEFQELQSSPDPGCGCAACLRATKDKLWIE
jgi:hypothetical protein